MTSSFSGSGLWVVWLAVSGVWWEVSGDANGPVTQIGLQGGDQNLGSSQDLGSGLELTGWKGGESGNEYVEVSCEFLHLRLVETVRWGPWF